MTQVKIIDVEGGVGQTNKWISEFEATVNASIKDLSVKDIKFSTYTVEAGTSTLKRHFVAMVIFD